MQAVWQVFAQTACVCVWKREREGYGYGFAGSQETWSLPEEMLENRVLGVRRAPFGIIFWQCQTLPSSDKNDKLLRKSVKRGKVQGEVFAQCESALLFRVHYAFLCYFATHTHTHTLAFVLKVMITRLRFAFLLCVQNYARPKKLAEAKTISRLSADLLCSLSLSLLSLFLFLCLHRHCMSSELLALMLY